MRRQAAFQPGDLVDSSAAVNVWRLHAVYVLEDETPGGSCITQRFGTMCHNRETPSGRDRQKRMVIERRHSSREFPFCLSRLAYRVYKQFVGIVANACQSQLSGQGWRRV